MKFRELRADEIEVRDAMRKTDKGIQLLLYKNARADMEILDETLGAMNWQREHYECKGSLFCRVGIFEAPRDEWIWKSDAGSETQIEAEKGEASDSFKRACSNWGIGRSLYTAPFIFLHGNVTELRKDSYHVNAIEYDSGKITAVAIANRNNEIVYTWGKFKGENKKQAKPARVNNPCCICGKETPENIAKKSVTKYGAIYCSKECFDRRNNNA